MLKLENVALNYYSKNGETLALENISFEVQQGELISIVGPSGCGKTTILSLISGLIKPSKGSIKINNKDVSPNNSGYMFQKDHLFDWRTIEKNVYLGIEIQQQKYKKYEKEEQRRRITEDKNHAIELLKKYGLYEFKDKYPNQLSGGMRQRVALIRTLALKPEILLLDEAFSALDFQTRLNVCNDVHNILKSENKTAIMVTHDISEAISMSDRVIVLTSRPAKVKTIHNIKLTSKTPLSRREEAQFNEYFNQIWEELT